MIAKRLENHDLQYVDDSQELREILNYLGIPAQYQPDITGALVGVADGDYSEVWLTESSRPYSIYADYETPSYYLS